MKSSKSDLTERIFSATDRLMAKEGLHHLSMHKLAKEAGIASGTIYLYFKNKDELLNQFAHRVFHRFMSVMEKDFDDTKPLFEQYRGMWWNIWNFLQEDPTVLSNMNQYRSLPDFADICKDVSNSCWDSFCEKGRKAGILAELPPSILFMLSLKTAMVLASDMKLLGCNITDKILESIIECSWRAIQK